jgi:hypothetical protein
MQWADRSLQRVGWTLLVAFMTLRYNARIAFVVLKSCMYNSSAACRASK